MSPTVLPALAPDVSALLGAPALDAAKIASEQRYRDGWANSPHRLPLSPEIAKRSAINQAVEGDLQRLKTGELTVAEVEHILSRVRAILECAPSTERTDRLEDDSIADCARFSFRLTRTLAGR